MLPLTSSSLYCACCTRRPTEQALKTIVSSIVGLYDAQQTVKVLKTDTLRDAVKKVGCVHVVGQRGCVGEVVLLRSLCALLAACDAAPEKSCMGHVM